jgi:hypothetical protein
VSTKSDRDFVKKIEGEARSYKGARMRLKGEDHRRLLKLAGIDSTKLKQPATRMRRVVTVLQRCEAAMAGIEQAMANEVAAKLDPKPQINGEEALLRQWHEDLLKQAATNSFVKKFS